MPSNMHHKLTMDESIFLSRFLKKNSTLNTIWSSKIEFWANVERMSGGWCIRKVMINCTIYAHSLKEHKNPIITMISLLFSVIMGQWRGMSWIWKIYSDFFLALRFKLQMKQCNKSYIELLNQTDRVQFTMHWFWLWKVICISTNGLAMAILILHG